jgi:hypothetical protein
MPKELEKVLKKEAREKFPGDKERQNAYVYGTLRKTGWVPEREKKSKSKKSGK